MIAPSVTPTGSSAAPSTPGTSAACARPAPASSAPPASPKAASAAPAAAPEAVDVLLQASVSAHDWALIGASSITSSTQRLSLRLPAAGDDGGGAPTVLRWRLLPLQNGYLPLPLLAAWSVRSPDGAPLVVGKPLPPPVMASGTRVDVEPMKLF